MPAHDPPASQRLTRFINARLLLPDGTLSLPSPLTIDSESGLIVPSAPISAVARYDTVDLKGLILSPGMIDLQINGAFGVDLSDWRGDTDDYERGLRRMSEGLVKMGVTR